MSKYIEAMMFSPKWHHYIFIVILLPFSFLYGFIMIVRRLLTQKKDFGIPIISVGNLIVGGSGKTPFVIALAERYDEVAVISRGYGRESKGLIEVSQKGKVCTTVEQSGDEAMLMAISLPNASVIVSEDRPKAIEFAKSKGAKIIVLDDGFSRVNILKFEILLEPESIKNYLPFPSGAFREFFFMKRYADLSLVEGKDFKREVFFENLTEKMLLVTAISNPSRLDKYLPKGVISKFYLADHSYFDESELEKNMKKVGATTLLVTGKDEVKMRGFKLPLSKIKLKLNINNEILIKCDEYLNSYKRKNS
ncbi:Tetraacyldisaccharide 4'-kinase [hydrothermal vent metagenome]|uniref:tetraacyldisaccharide 4'-kinase n=1 Tax=hydrothermal vent metagenome TaxID=652676 RepID=A0A1W1ECF4_9ZZZZ